MFMSLMCGRGYGYDGKLAERNDVPRVGVGMGMVVDLQKGMAVHTPGTVQWCPYCYSSVVGNVSRTSAAEY